MFFKWDDPELLDYLILPNIGNLKFDLIELLPDEVDFNCFAIFFNFLVRYESGMLRNLEL